MSETDKRQKLREIDYQKIKFAIHIQNHTIRQVANEFGCSTKYVHRLIQFNTTETQTTVCSGCSYSYSSIDLLNHWAIYTSGGTKALSCGAISP